MPFIPWRAIKESFAVIPKVFFAKNVGYTVACPEKIFEKKDLTELCNC